MYRIVSKEQFSEKVFRLRVEAPLIAKAYRAGNFVIVRVGEKGERIPLTVAAYDRHAGTVTVIFQTVGATAVAGGGDKAAGGSVFVLQIGGHIVFDLDIMPFAVLTKSAYRLRHFPDNPLHKVDLVGALID